MSMVDLLKGAPVGVKAIKEEYKRTRWTVMNGGALGSFEADTHTLLLEQNAVVFALSGETVAIVSLASAAIVCSGAEIYR